MQDLSLASWRALAPEPCEHPSWFFVYIWMDCAVKPSLQIPKSLLARNHRERPFVKVVEMGMGWSATARCQLALTGLLRTLQFWTHAL
jgi:hypothetical protein